MYNDKHNIILQFITNELTLYTTDDIIIVVFRFMVRHLKYNFRNPQHFPQKRIFFLLKNHYIEYNFKRVISKDAEFSVCGT